MALPAQSSQQTQPNFHLSGLTATSRRIVIHTRGALRSAASTGTRTPSIETVKAGCLPPWVGRPLFLSSPTCSSSSSRIRRSSCGPGAFRRPASTPSTVSNASSSSSSSEDPEELFNRLYQQALPILETYDIRTQVTRLPPRSGRRHPLGLGHYLQLSPGDGDNGQVLPLAAKAAAKQAAEAAPRQTVSTQGLRLNLPPGVKPLEEASVGFRQGRVSGYNPAAAAAPGGSCLRLFTRPIETTTSAAKLNRAAASSTKRIVLGPNPRVPLRGRVNISFMLASAMHTQPSTGLHGHVFRTIAICSEPAPPEDACGPMLEP